MVNNRHEWLILGIRGFWGFTYGENLVPGIAVQVYGWGGGCVGAAGGLGWKCTRRWGDQLSDTVFFVLNTPRPPPLDDLESRKIGGGFLKRGKKKKTSQIFSDSCFLGKSRKFSSKKLGGCL